MNRIRGALYLLSFMSGATPLTAAGHETTARLLDSVGGGETWRQARYVHSYALNHHPDARLPYTQEAWIDLAEARHRIELCNFDMQRARAFTPTRGWGYSEGSYYEFDRQRLDDELRAWRTRIYRKLQLVALASEDTVVDVEGDYIHVTHSGDYLGWILVDAATGAPLSTGDDRDERTGVRFGALRAFDGVAWVASGQEAGGWSFETMAFELLGEDADIAFEPDGSEQRLCPSVRTR